MMYFLRPNRHHLGWVALAAAAAFAPQAAHAQATEITQLLQEPSPLLSTAGSQGYLGVLVGDVDADSAAKLKLKEVRGAVITLIDHDAPAAQSGLRVNDVILQINGQAVEGAEQLRRMLREIPAGRKISLLISRDGNEQTVAAQLVDHKTMEHEVWKKLGSGGDAVGPSGPGLTILGGDTPSSSLWRFSIFGPSFKVGAMVEPLTSQMAEYLGVSSGLMVKQVARKTDADAAGLKAFDVILKVGADPIATAADWERALRANQGKSVQLTILRDKKQQTLTLKVDTKHNRGEIEMEDLFTEGDCPLVAELEPWDPQQPGWDSAAAAEEMRKQAEALRDQLRNGVGEFKIDPQQAEAFRKQAEELRERLKNLHLRDFKIDPKQAEEMRKQAEEMRKQAEALRDSLKGMNLDQFDRKQMDELNRQMEEWRKNFNPDDFKIDPKQMEQFRQQMDEWRKNFKPELLQPAPEWN